MSELTIGQLIKIILGMIVVVVVIIGIYLIFKDKILGFFRQLPGGESANLLLGMIK